ncbi:uncharacterized protein LOC122003767 [Zingiber officinale]|uniref:uncharacterized protein LOC122003767 n=1 Tax=Zingiber officinale TaxID=94328 RepID=UPI001C4A7839|nr:uncharacterized protein LOC122003767 [Zingiber officinale]
MTDHNKRWLEQEGRLEDRLTSLDDDLLISILSFLSIKQRVALSAVSARFRLLLPSIPRLDAFRLDVGLPPGGVSVHQELTFPRALIRQCRVVFFRIDVHPEFIFPEDVAHLPKHLKQLLVDDLVEAGVQDLILQNFKGKGWLNFSDRDCSFFRIKSLRSLSLDRIRVSKYSNCLPLSPLGCTLLTSLEMKFSALCDDFLVNLFASCPFLEHLQLFRCYALENGMNKLSFHSASIKSLFLSFQIDKLPSIIDVRAPQLESLIVPVVTTLRIEAPKVQNASFLLSLKPPTDPPGELKKLFRASFRTGAAHLWLNSSKIPNKIPNILIAANKIGEVNSIFRLDFNLKDQSSTTILTELLKKCNNCCTKFNIYVDPTRMHINTETTKDDQHLLHGSTELELINLQMLMQDI